MGPTPGHRELWHQGRRRYAVWLLRVEVPAVRARQTLVMETLQEHGLASAVPEPHVTIFTPGFPTRHPRFDDDVHEEALSAQERVLREHARVPPKLSITSANAFLSCVYLEVHEPQGVLSGWREHLQLHGHEVGRQHYVPHLTVAPFGDSRSTPAIVAALRPLRDLPPIVVEPEALELVELDAWDGARPMVTTARIPLR